MAARPRLDLDRQFRTLFESGTVSGLTDGQLLERFLARSELASEAAFAALLAKHGPMVLGVCRRALADPEDVADAFQATFLILVRKAGSIRVDDSLGRWLYGVSRRVAGRARVAAARRSGNGGDLDQVAARSDDPDRWELAALIDEELAHLPRVYRAAIIHCDLGGASLEEAARDLVCPVGTIKSRLARGRRRLRDRLERRGLAPLASLPIAELPAALARSTARLAALAAGSGSPSAGVVPVAGAALAQEVLKAMTGLKIKVAAATMLSLGLVATGASVVARGQTAQGSTGQPGPSRPEHPPADGGLAGRLTRLDREIGRARGELATAREAAADPADPGVVRARSRVDRLEAGRARILATLDEVDGPATGGPVAPGRRGIGPGGKPAIEGEKVSLPDYIVEPPDLLNVEVLEALPGRPISGEHLVRPDGKVSLGFYGEVYVAGLTTREIKAKTVLHLRKYLDDNVLGLTRKDPATGRDATVEPADSNRVFVDVASYNSKVYYIQGDVGSPGRLPCTGNETVLDAFQHAAGSPTAVSKLNVRLIRPGTAGPGSEVTLNVDLDAIIARGETATNYQIFPGDRIVVYRAPEAERTPDSIKPAASDVEARLLSVERKLDEVIKALERLPKP